VQLITNLYLLGMFAITMVKNLVPQIVFIISILLISIVHAKTSQLYCHNESQTWPQSGKIYSSNKIMFFRIEFSSDGNVTIYQEQDKEPITGTFDKKLIKSDSKTGKGFERNLVIDLQTGDFTDRYYVFNKGNDETAWIDRGKCDI